MEDQLIPRQIIINVEDFFIRMLQNPSHCQEDTTVLSLDAIESSKDDQICGKT